MRLFYVSLLAFFLASCASKPLENLPVGRDETRKEDFGKVFGPEFLMFGKPKNMRYGDTPGGGGMRVNPYLWQATLETVSFMPLASADAVGGVIVTDWYTTPSNINERIKMTIHIQDRQLRADAITVRLYKQILRQGSWITATADDATNRQIEDIILSKARDLKIAATSGSSS